MNSLISKINRDNTFGKDPEFREFYDSGRSDSGSSNVSPNSGGGGQPEKDRTIVDLDVVVEKWITYMWEKTKSAQSGKGPKCELEDLEIVVNWARVELIQSEAQFERGPAPRSHAPVAQTLFRTYFVNNTNQEQEYSFKTERSTRQSCGFSFTKGFCREKEGGVTFKIPQDIIEIGGGIRSEQFVEAGKDQTKEETVTWSVDSVIKVQPHTKTSASLVITELEFDRNFTVETRLKGRLTVTLNNKRENNQFVKSFSGDIVEIISKANERLWLPPGGSIFEIGESNGQKFARTVLKGKCKFRLGVEQKVTLAEEKV